MMRAEHFEALAAVLDYPRDGYLGEVGEAVQQLTALCPEAGEALKSFVKRVHDLDIEQLRELFTRTFDLDPDCCLDVGWHLFGDHYDRGDFLVRMRGHLRRLGVEESTELPDHLTHVLRALARMDADEAAEFISTYGLPALDKMRARLVDKDNPYEQVLHAVREALAASQSVRKQGAHHA